MKKLRTISLMLSLTLIAGCSSPIESKRTVILNNSLPTSIVINSLVSGFSKEPLYGLGGEMIRAEGQGDLWAKNMSDKYGVDITLHVNYTAPSEAIAASESKVILANTDILLPLDDYLKDNKVWNTLPQAMRDIYKINGETWAIPLGFELEPHSRLIRKDWLQQLGLTAPTDIYEFEDILKKFKDNSSQLGDGNSITPLAVNNMIEDMLDIWEAFGIHFSQSKERDVTYRSSVSWDVENAFYMDQMLKPDAILALQYIRNLYSNGLVEQIYNSDGKIDTSKVYDNTQAKQDGRVGSYLSVMGDEYDTELAENILINTKDKTIDYSRQADLNLIESFYTALQPISGTVEKPIQYQKNIAADGNAYVLPKDMREPKESINFFVDLLFSSKQSFLECFIGTDDIWTIDSTNHVTINKPENLKNELCLAGLNSYVLGLYDQSDFSYSLSNNDITKAQQSFENKKADMRVKKISNALANGQCIVLNGVQTTPLSQLSKDSTSDYLGTLLYNAIANPNMTVTKAIDEYRSSCKIAGMQTYLDDINTNAFAKSIQTY